MSLLRLHFLGPFQATLDGKLIQNFRSDKGRALLAHLATQEGRLCARENLVGLLWGEDEERAARASLRQVLSNWRKLFAPLLAGDPPPLEIGRRTIRLQVEAESVWVDALHMQTLIAACDQHPHASILTCNACHESLAKAVSLYQGEFLADLQILNAGPWFDEWRLVQQEHYHQKALQALGMLAEGARALGERDQEIGYLRRQLALLPWLEESHRVLMAALAETGRRAEAIAQFETCQRLMRQELGVDPSPETLELYQQIVAGKLAKLMIDTTPKHNLPAANTSFVGREAELARIDKLLADASYRLITLTGLGGAGKTRLAQEVGRQQLSRFAHGVWFVSFADIQVDQAIGSEPAPQQTLAIVVLESLRQRIVERELLLDQLRDYLHQKEILLILDNLEQLLPQATEFVLTLLESAPGLRILATSQVPLNCKPEMSVPLGGLALPAADTAEKAPLASIQLFVERARRHRPEFQLDDHNVASVGKICRLTGGFPLAIELAAELINHYPLTELAAAIDANLDLLKSQLGDMPPRQHSMRAVLNQGLQLLTEQERLILAQASVFGGEFGREAILAVTDASLSDVVNLVNRTWITLTRPGRYALHGLVRQIAAEILAETPQTEVETRARFARYFANFLLRQAMNLTSANQSMTLEAIGREFTQIRRAWRWFLTHCDSTGSNKLLSDMARSIGHFLGDQGRYWDGLQLFEESLAQLAHPDHCLEPTVQDHLTYWLAHFLYRNGRYQDAISKMEALCRTFRASQDMDYHAAALLDLGSILIEFGTKDTDRIYHLLQEALSIHEPTHNDRGTAAVFTKLGLYWEMIGNYEKASVSHQRSVHLWRKIGAPKQLATALNQWALLLHRQGENEQANELLKESAELNRQMGSRPELAAALANRGLVETALAHYETAEYLLKEAWQIQEDQGNRARVAIILNNLGDIANLQGKHGQAQAYLEESLRIKEKANNQRGMTFSLIHLGHALYGLEDFEAAEQTYRHALQLAAELSLQPLELASLVGIAQLLASQQPERALALLQLPLTHPASWQRIQEEARVLSEQVAVSLRPDQEETAIMQGKGLDLDEVVAVILADSPW